MRIKKEKKRTRRLLTRKGEGYVDSGVKILIAIVIGALLLSGLYLLFNSTVMPTVKSKVESMFDYNGGSGGSGGNITYDDAYPGESGEVYSFATSNQTASKNQSVTFALTEVNFTKFTAVRIDGKIASGDDYHAFHIRPDDTGTVVSLYPEQVAKYERGEHTIRVILDDGYADGVFIKDYD